jgi:DhnA family fructose-bisphosphate aldolase class Ia
MTIDITDLLTTRVQEPGRIAELAESRRRPGGLVGATGRLMLVAADHPARGALRGGAAPLAMADRWELLRRLAMALSRPGVDGVLGTADIIEDLLLMGCLDDKVVIGSMNRGGLAGTTFEIDDRFTGYDAAAVHRMGLQGGKMLLRIDPEDTLTAGTLEACASAVGELAAHGLMAMVEPFISHRQDGRLHNDLSTEAVVRSATVAAGLGWTSAHTWLKLPVVDDMERVLASTNLPVVLLGGEVSADQDAQFATWQKVLAQPQVRGMVVGRSLLYPPNGDIAGAVDAVVEMM